MTNHRVGLTVLLVAVAVAGIIIGNAFAGLNDRVTMTQAQSPDTVPILQAIATSVAPSEPTASPTPRLVDTLPVCSDPNVASGDLCAPVRTEYGVCEQFDYVPERQYAYPCHKP